MKNKEKKLFAKKKGEVGYIASKKRTEAFCAAAIFLFAAGLFILGLALNDWNKGNIFTIVSLVMVIPVANHIVALVLFFPFRSVTPEKAAEVETHVKQGGIIYSDVVITSVKKAMNLDFVVVTGDKIIGVLAKEKENCLDVRNYIQDMVVRRGYDFKVTIADNYTKFYSLLKASDAVVREDYESDEDWEALQKERKAMCDELESLMP